MNKMRVKVLSILMSIVLLTGISPYTAFAVYGDSEPAKTITATGTGTSDWSDKSGTYSISVDKTTVKQGDSITFTISHDVGDDIYGIKMSLYANDKSIDLTNYFESVLDSSNQSYNGIGLISSDNSELNKLNVANNTIEYNGSANSAARRSRLNVELKGDSSNSDTYSPISSITNGKKNELFSVTYKVKDDAPKGKLIFDATKNSTTKRSTILGYLSDQFTINISAILSEDLEIEIVGKDVGKDTEVTAPTFNNIDGTSGELTINCTTDSSSIYYTTDNSEFSTGENSTWKKYDDENKPTITEATTIRAIAVKEGFVNSEIVKEAYYKVEKSSNIETQKGDIDISHVIASAGTTITIKPNAKEGYQFDKATYTYSGTTCDINGTTFTMPEGNVTVNAEFISQTGTSVPAAVPVVSLVKDDWSETKENVSLNGIIGQTLPTLKVNAAVTDGGTLSYQWQKNTSDPNTGDSGWEDITNATDKTYTPPSDVSTGSDGKIYYRCIVTNQLNGRVARTTSPYYELICKIKVTQSEHGSVSVDIGTEDTVTVTVAPDSGYTLDKLTVQNGNSEIEVTQESSTTYSFKMPDGNVSVGAVFKELITKIKTKADLLTFAADVNAGADYGGLTVELKSDLEVTEEWTPIGSLPKNGKNTDVRPFRGTFEGNGHTVTITSTDSQKQTSSNRRVMVGFFGYVSDNAEIRNLNVAGKFSVTGIEDKAYVGGIVALAGGGFYTNSAGTYGNIKITGCTNYVNIETKAEKEAFYVGGILGQTELLTLSSLNWESVGPDISDCKNYGDINADCVTLTKNVSKTYVGGIAGRSGGNVQRCANYGDVSGTYAGGICSLAVFTISSCTNQGSVSAVNRLSYYAVDLGAAGIVYALDESTSTYTLSVVDCYNTGDIEAKQPVNEAYVQSYPYCNGIAGRGYKITLKNCYNTGSLTTNNPTVDSDKKVKYGEISPEYIYEGGNYGGFEAVKLSTVREKCYTAAELEALGSTAEQAAALGDGYQENVAGTPILSWETAPDPDAEYHISFNITGYEGDCDIVLTDGTKTYEAVDGKYTLHPGKYSYVITGGEYGNIGSFGVNSDKTVDVKLESAAIVTFDVNPSDAAVSVKAVESSGSVKQISSLKYMLTPGCKYEYEVSADGYTGKVVSDYVVPETDVAVPVSLVKRQEQTSAAADKYISGDKTISSGGTYYISKGAAGTITIKTTDKVTLVGQGVSSADRYSDLLIDCAVAGVNLTIEDLYIQNNVGQGTASGDTNAGINIINFTGKGNTLNFNGTNLLENMTYVKAAGIHVPHDASLTIGKNSSGTLYMYKYSQGSGIGGDEGEACGEITFAGGDIFIKGSKTGAVIGGDAVNGDINGDITISGGNLNIVNKAMGAAIGASSQGTCAGAVYISGGVTTIITDYSGSAIGRGGGTTEDIGSLTMTGGTLKCVRTNNSTTGNWNSGKQQVDDSLIRVDKGNLARLIFDAKGGSVTVDNGYGTVSAGHNYFYSESNASTMSNWSCLNDDSVYLYLDKTKTYKLTGAGSTYSVKWNEAEGEFDLTDIKTGTTISGGVGGSSTTTAPVVETPVQQTEVTTETKVDGTNATVTADSAALAEAAKTADANTQFVISGDVGDADVSQVTANVEKDSVKAVAEAGASVKVETPVANITLPNEALKDIAAQSGATVSVTAELKADGSTTINLSVDSKSMTKLSGGIKAAIPVILDKISKGINRTTISDSKVPLGETPDSTESTETDTTESTTDSAVSVDMNGLVAVLVGDDGTESIIPKSVIENGTAYVLLDGSATVKVADNSKTFTDVADTWYTDAVNFAAGHELFNGVSGSEFAPLNKMSRAMLVTVLHRLEGTPSSTTATSFSDVESGKWYTDAISWANANDIVNGLGDGLFGTNNNITREQMATILYRYMNEQGLSVSASGDISSFPDGDAVSSYAEEAMSWAIGSGIITGKDSAEGTLLDPKGSASRAEVATMLKRMVGIMVK
jgi:hypothetical protein